MVSVVPLVMFWDFMSLIFYRSSWHTAVSGDVVMVVWEHSFSFCLLHWTQLNEWVYFALLWQLSGFVLREKKLIVYWGEGKNLCCIFNFVNLFWQASYGWWSLLTRFSLLNIPVCMKSTKSQMDVLRFSVIFFAREWEGISTF